MLSVASCYGNQDKLRPCWPPWPECDFYTILVNPELKLNSTLLVNGNTVTVGKVAHGLQSAVTVGV